MTRRISSSTGGSESGFFHRLSSNFRSVFPSWDTNEFIKETITWRFRESDWKDRIIKVKCPKPQYIMFCRSMTTYKYRRLRTTSRNNGSLLLRISSFIRTCQIMLINCRLLFRRWQISMAFKYEVMVRSQGHMTSKVFHRPMATSTSIVTRPHR